MPPHRRGTASRHVRSRGSVKDRLNFSARVSPQNAASKPSQQANRQNQYKYNKFARGTKRASYQSSGSSSTRTENYYDPSKTWFKVTAFSCANIGKDLVTKLIRDFVSTDSNTFKPYHVQEEGSSVVFYICGEELKNAVMSWRNRIKLPNNTKLSLKCTPSVPPLINLKQEDVIAKIQAVMSARYNSVERSLDLSAFKQDPSFVDSGLFVPISREPIFEAVIKIIRDDEFLEQNLYKLSLSKNDLARLNSLAPLASKCLALRHIDLSDNQIRRTDVSHLKDFTLDDLRLAGNPICRSFDSTADYVSFMRSQLTRLTRLDGHELPAAIGFDLGDTQLPPTLGSFVPDNVKQIVENFILQYYRLFDMDGSQGRNELAAGYHTDAMFSMSVVPPESSSSSNNDHHYHTSARGGGRPATNMDILLAENRNILKISNSGDRQRLLRRKRDTIMTTFAGLPSTRHVLETFIVDVPLIMTEPVSFMQIVINGLFKDMSRTTTPLRAFTRVFTILPQPDGNGLSIFNDLWLIQSPSVEQVKRYNALNKTTTTDTTMSVQTSTSTSSRMNAYSMASPATTSSNVGQVDMGNAAKELAVQTIMQKTRMNRGFSYKLLAEEGWQTNKALETFQQVFAANGIPSEAFQPDG